MDKELIKNILRIEFAYDLEQHEDEGEAKVEDVATKIVKASDCIPSVSNCIHCGEDENKHSEYAKICPNEFNCFERNDC